MRGLTFVCSRCTQVNVLEDVFGCNGSKPPVQAVEERSVNSRLSCNSLPRTALPLIAATQCSPIHKNEEPLCGINVVVPCCVSRLQSLHLCHLIQKSSI